MRKQTKLVAVLSAAALLAIGASMTSFAATGWVEEDGTWVYYDKNGDKATEEWQKSGDQWFYLDDNGEMATEIVVETNDNYYYVDENGAMAANRWVEVPNEDYDGDDEEPVNNWYYFQSNGKAMKGSDNGNVSLKTINGKKYTFDEEGKMLYGWVNDQGERETGDDAWSNAEYYFGDENNGAMTIGWLELDIIDDSATDSDTLDTDVEYDDDTAFDDEDQSRFFYFKTNGKKIISKSGETINGKKYAFDENGRMVAEWRMNGGKAKKVVDDLESTASSASKNNAIKATTTVAERSSSWRFYGSPEDGARVTKGWFQVVPSSGLNTEKYDDDDNKWYYSDNDGLLVAGEIKTITGKKYAFDMKGSMMDGLQFISVDPTDKNEITATHDDADYDTEDEFDVFANKTLSESEYANTYCYYFGDGDDGSMKTGKQTIDIDGDDFSFLLNKSGGLKGTGQTGEDDSKFYLAGKLMKADKEDKYSVVKVTLDAQKAATKYELLTTDDFVTGTTTAKASDEVEYSFPRNTATEVYYLVNTSGKIIEDKSKAKDGDDYIYNVEDNEIKRVYEEK